MSDVREGCREWSMKGWCGLRAVVILYGARLDPEGLGPRCKQHAEQWLGMHLDEALDKSVPLFDLRDLRRGSPLPFLKKGFW